MQQDRYEDAIHTLQSYLGDVVTDRLILDDTMMKSAIQTSIKCLKERILFKQIFPSLEYGVDLYFSNVSTMSVHHCYCTLQSKWIETNKTFNSIIARFDDGTIETYDIYILGKLLFLTFEDAKEALDYEIEYRLYYMKNL